jgi:azurin
MTQFKLLGLASCMLFLTSCFQAEEKKQTEEVVIPPEKKELVEIGIIAKGESMAEIAFEPNSINIPANSRVKLLFINKSEAEGMFHNFVLVSLGAGQEIATKGLKAGKAKDFVPKDERVIVNTPLLAMGETVTIEFDAPPKGSYHYICTFPGHTNMVGRLNVQ